MLKEVRTSLFNKNGRTKLNILLNAIIAFVALILAVEICFSINYEGVYVVGRSMLPTLVGADSENVIGGDYVYVNKHAEPTYGDIVVVYHKQEGWIIKRVIALGGDSVKLVEGQLYIRYKGTLEFEPIEEPYIICSNLTATKNNFPGTDNGYLITEGYIFLMGDNRDESLDSRELGSFPLSSLDGVVTEWSFKHKSFCTALYNYFRFQLPGYFGFN